MQTIFFYKSTQQGEDLGKNEGGWTGKVESRRKTFLAVGEACVATINYYDLLQASVGRTPVHSGFSAVGDIIYVNFSVPH